MAFTKRGQIIYDYFKNNPSKHPTAEEVYDELKKQDITIGVATVYRNLRNLVEQGILREINIEKQGVRYDFLEHEHYHFICDTCGNIENFMLDTLQQINTEVEDTTQGIILSKDLVFRGICKTCKDKHSI